MTMLQFYGQRKFRQHRWYRYIGKQRATEDAVRFIVNGCQFIKHRHVKKSKTNNKRQSPSKKFRQYRKIGMSNFKSQSSNNDLVVAFLGL